MYIKELVWTSEVSFKRECLAGSQDIKGWLFSLEKHCLLSQLQLYLTGTILINKLITQITETLNLSQLLLGTEMLSGLLEKPSSAPCLSLQKATPLTAGPTTAPFQSGGPQRAQLSWGRTPFVQGACRGWCSLSFREPPRAEG